MEALPRVVRAVLGVQQPLILVFAGNFCTLHVEHVHAPGEQK